MTFIIMGQVTLYFPLCDWMDRNPFVGSPFKECRKVEFSASVNYQAKYTDMMLYTKPDEVSGIAA